MSFIEDFNTNISSIKTEIETLFARSKKQIQSLLDKSNSSFVELLNIFRRNETLEDTFVDSSRINLTEGLVFDKTGWTNEFRIENVPFLPELETQETFPMEMEGGRLIPGSNFSKIFRDREGFWGFMRDDGIKVSADFALTLAVSNDQPSREINRVHLRTNNVLDVQAFYRTEFGGSWISLGTQPGQDHVWMKNFNAVELRFVAITDIFAISFVAAGKAFFTHTGKLVSDYFDVEDLRLLSVAADTDEPDKTTIQKFINIQPTISGVPPEVSGWIPWEEETIVTLANDEIAIPAVSGTTIPNGFVEESLVLRTGQQQWEELNTTDFALVTETVDRLGTSFLDIPAGHQIIVGGVTSLFHGQTSVRTEFALDEDYTVLYDVSVNTIQIIYTFTGDLPSVPEVEPTAEVLLRKPVTVIQRRTFVDLEQDGDITITIPTSGITVRTLHLGDSIENENTTQSVPIGTFTFEGQKGLNLIEVEGHNIGNPPEFVGTFTYFSNRFRQRRVSTPGPGANEFFLDPGASESTLISGEDNLFLRYLIPTGNNKVAVKFEFQGTDLAAPILRSYKLINRVDKT